MAIAPTSSDQLTSTRRTAAGNRFSDLSSEDFIKIITTELTKQDPLKPNDTNTLLTQISSIREIESQVSLKSSLDSLVGQSSFASASNMLGATISGVGTLPNGNQARVNGTVISVARTSKGPQLTLSNGATVLFSNVDNVTLPTDTAPPQNPTPTPTPTPVPLTPEQIAAAIALQAQPTSPSNIDDPLGAQTGTGTDKR